MSKWITILLICFSTTLSAQEWFRAGNVFAETDTFKVVIEANGRFTYQSDKLTKDFMNGFVYGGELDSSMRYGISQNLDEFNYAGAEWTYGVTAEVFADTFMGQIRWGWLAGIQEYNIINTKFHRDAFDLTFIGNKPFENDTAQIKNTQFDQLSFQKATFGVFDKKTGSSAAVSFIGGKQFSSIYINDLSLFTDTLGQQIDMSVDAAVNRSDTTPPSLIGTNGWGAGIDLNYYLRVQLDSGLTNLFKISVENLGFIRWNQSLTFNKDSSITYNGFESADLLDGDVSFFGEGNTVQDSLGWRYERGSHITMLPASFSITKVPDPQNPRKLQSLFGIRMMVAANYRPLAFLGAYYRLNETVALSMTGAWGGYGGYRIGLRGDIRTGKRDYLSFGISNLSSFTRVNNNGMGAYVNYRVAF